MTTPAPLSSLLLAALGLLGTSAALAAEVDTSQWKCQKCPYTKGSSGTVEAGLGYALDNTAIFGNYTGLPRSASHPLLGGSISHRDEGGYFVDLVAADFGLDTRSMKAQAGLEGQYALQLGFAEIPRYFAQGAGTPFLGNGGNVLTLPAGAGFPAATTAAMPLGSTVKATQLGYQASRFDVAGKWDGGQQGWTFRASLRRDMRDGTRPGAGSFFSTASQFAAPVDETTDQFELGAAYVTPQIQVTLGYLLSQFKNGNDALTWDNPFLRVQGGDTRGQLALAPNNQFQQLVGSAGYQISPTIRASADVAWGLGEQNASFLAPTLNANLAQTVPAMPTPSLGGQVETFNFSAKITATPMQGLRLNASYARDVRDNQTTIAAYAQVATDMFLSTALRSNTPFDLVQDRVKLSADYRGPDTWKLSGGVDWDNRQRSYQEVVTTTETTVWGRTTVQPTEQLALALKLAYGDRSNSAYGVAYWFGSTSNPLMRKLNLAARERGTVGVRADWAVSEKISLGLGADWTKDDYHQTVIGLNESEAVNLVADITVAASEQTSLRAFAQTEKITSRQTGSQLFGIADWSGKLDDRFQVFGFGVKHAVIPDKLDIGADLSFSRSKGEASTQTAVGEPPFPQAKTSLDSVKLYATYKLKESLWVTGSWWHERYTSTDWQLDGVQPATVSNLLTFGTPAPQYRANVLRVALRHRF